MSKLIDCQVIHSLYNNPPTQPRFENVPEPLKQYHQWCVWFMCEPPKSAKETWEQWQQKKAIKRPIHAVRGFPINIINSKHFCTYEQAKAFCEKYPFGKRGSFRAGGSRIYGLLGGIGFILTKDDPICGLDIDNCIKDGRLDPKAIIIIDKLDSYTEVSPSGNGIRIFTEAKLGEGSRNRQGNLEIYDCNRFLTVTGQQVEVGDVKP